MRPVRNICDNRGVTLVELLVTMVIMGIVSSIIYATYIYSIKSTVSHRIMSEMQTDARAALNFMTRELKMMGFDVPMDCDTPNDDGYPTYPTGAMTRYGPLDSGPKLVRASASEVVFAFKDLSVEEGKMDDGTTNLKLTQVRLVRYWKDGDKLKRETYRWDNETVAANRQWQLQEPAAEIIENVELFNLIYRKANSEKVGSYSGDVLSGNLSYSQRCDVKGRIDVTVKTKGKRDDPVTGDARYYELSTGVSIKNMGKATKCDEDTTAPPEPSITSLSDPQICGMLDVVWSPSAAADLAGYRIEVTSGGNVSQTTTPPDVTSARVGYQRFNFKTCLWTFPIFNNQDATVTVTAYDDCYNESTSDPETQNNLTADSPAVPVYSGFDRPDATADTTDGTWVKVEWTSNKVFDEDEIDVDYDVYRRVFGGPTWERRNQELVFPFERIPICNAVTYTDTFTAQQKCTKFEYMVTAVNACGGGETNSLSVHGDGPLADTDSPNDETTNTRPSEATSPAAPWGPGAGDTVYGKAGYRRNFLNWHNPIDEDLSHVALRYKKTGDPPPEYPQNATDGRPVEDVAGRADSSNFPTFGPGTLGLALTHTGSAAHDASLVDDATYYYSLFAVDTCGNESDAAATSELTVNQCSEEITGCQKGAPTWSDTGCSGVAGADFTVSGCTSNYNFTWNRIADETDSVIFDIAGYYVYKDTSGLGFNFAAPAGHTKASSLVLNPPGNPIWSDIPGSGYPSADDNPVHHGKEYMYYVIPIDCNRETNFSSNPWASVAEAPSPLPEPSEVISVKPGRVTFNKPIASQLTYYDSNPSAPYVVSGDLDMSDAGEPVSDSGYQHNTVEFYAYNESAEAVTLNSMNLSWSTEDTYLSELLRTDTSPNDTCIYGTCAAGSLMNSPATLSGLNLVFEGLTGGGESCTTTPCVIPFKAVFTSSAGTVTSAQDMREDALEISSLNFTKTFYSDVTSFTETCTHADPKVSILVDDDIAVPPGPEIAPDGGTFQEEDFSENVVGTPSTVVGTDNIPSTNGDVYVRIQIANSVGTTITDAYLYYATTKQQGPGSSSPPSIYGATPGKFAEIQLSETATLGVYLTDTGMTVAPDKRIWYFMLVKDSQGNWDRHPEMENTTDFTAFVYDQDDPCTNTPSNPTGVTLDVGTMTVSWTAPTFNDDGSDIYDLAGFYVYQSLDGAAATLVATLDPADTSYTDVGMDDGTLVSYEIVAFDECLSPAPNESAAASSSAVYKGLPYNFDDGTLQDWTADGLWHLSTCKASSAPFSVYYGIEPGVPCGTFDTVGLPNSGSLTSPAIVLGATPSLSFSYSLAGECGVGAVCFYDKLRVQISAGGPWITLEDLPDTGGVFTPKTYDLTADYAGQTVQIRFFFDTIDAVGNTAEGALIDDVNFSP